MLYKIGEKFYIKVGKDFVEVEMVYTKNDVDLKPTRNKIENDGSVKYTEVNFLNIKSDLLKKHNESKYNNDSNKEDNKNKYSRLR